MTSELMLTANDSAVSIENTSGANANGARNDASELGGTMNDGSTARTVAHTITPPSITAIHIVRVNDVIRMRTSLVKTLFGSGILLLSTLAVKGQNYPTYPPYSGDPYYRGPAYNNRPYAGSWGMELYDRVGSDLDRAAFDVHGSRRHIDHARKEVKDVERQLSRGRFDKDEMGEAIASVQHVVDRDFIPEVDRSMLLQDLAQMREFRAWSDGRNENSGYYPYYAR